ncbi:MAG TPA: LLM class flavin-dependent oxidoreductase [Actinomycetes bacterium]|nr:LLM class flavin-dependent oxidoreductase [Actinomycetes bacterium]
MRFSIFSVTDHYPDQPRGIAQFYDQLLDEVVLAEELGFEAFFVAEHHFHEYGIVPCPPALLGAAAARTSRIGLGVAVSVLPFHHPLVAAEEYALLDQLSRGRLALGVGSGYLRHEFEGFLIDPSEKRQRFEEALDIILQAWSGEPVTYSGRYHRVDGARSAVTPLQRPHPPLWTAILRPEAAWHVGRQGRDIMLIPYATSATVDDLGQVVAEFTRGRAESGTAGGDVAVAMHTYVAERPEQARPEAEQALGRYVRTRLYARQRSYDELEQAGLILFGDPDQVSRRIGHLETLGVTHLLLLVNFGALEAERVRASMERFAKSVMPEFAAGPAGPA